MRVTLCALWTALGLFFGLRTALEWRLIVGHNDRLVKALWWHLMEWYLWGLLAVGVFALCRWMASRRQPLWRYVLLHLVAGAVVSFLHAGLCTVAGMLESWALGWPRTPHGDAYSFATALDFTIVNHLQQNILVYVALVLAWHTLDYSRESQRRQVHTAELQARLAQAQLQALRAQLQPHFLFNTLNAIAELIHQDPAKAEELIVHLGELLRLALQSAPRQEVSLAEEVEFLKRYVEVEQIRLGDRLRVLWHLPEETLRAAVPNFILQPLVENAIRHGIAPFARGGELTISAERREDKLLLQVQDDGPGLAQSLTRVGVGLANTESRLRQIYGAEQRFELLEKDGLLAKVTIPFTSTVLSNELPDVNHRR